MNNRLEFRKLLSNMQNQLRIVFIALASAILAGCASRYEHSFESHSTSRTSIHSKHANRGYNKPYEINGVLYTPQKTYELNQIGIASYYGGTDVFHGRPTSTGERFDMNEISAAHKTLPLPCVVRITNLENNRSIKVKVNDRGPFVEGRIIDVSRKVAQLLGFYQKGTAKVQVETVLEDTLILAENYSPSRPTLLAANVSQETNVFQEDAKILLAQNTKTRKKQSLRKKQPSREDKPLLLAANSGKNSPQPNQKHRQNLNALVENIVQEAVVDPLLQQVSQKISAPSKPVFIEAGLFTHYPNAHGAKQKLSSNHKRPIKIETVHFSNQRLFRVLVGPFESSQAAHYLLQQMVESGHKRARLVVL